MFAEELIMEVLKSFNLGALEYDENLQNELAFDIIIILIENGFLNDTIRINKTEES